MSSVTGENMPLVKSPFTVTGAIGKKYKLFLMGNEAKTDGVGIFVAEKWADSVGRVERHSV